MQHIQPPTKLVSDQVSLAEVSIIRRELQSILATGIQGDVVEFGCYVGTTSLFIQYDLQGRSENRKFHAYDSFAGLPEKTRQDSSTAGTQFKAGELFASKHDFIRNFKQAHLPVPIIHKAWFDNLTPKDIPSNIAFAFLDGDFYASIRTSLHLIQKRLNPGATIVVDDYQSSALPGATRAVDEWLAAHPTLSCRHEQSLAIIHLPATGI